MSIDLRNGYSDLRQHVGHEVVCVAYGPPEFRATSRLADDVHDPWNVSLECETCGVVLLDFDAETEKEDA